MTPVLLKPSLLGIKNRWRVKTGHPLSRDLMVVAFSLLIMRGIYTGALGILQVIHHGQGPGTVHPSLSLNLVLLVLFGILLFSGLIVSTSALFLGKDLELVLAAPMSSWRFFINKLLEILLQCSWTTAVFVIPLVLAYGTHFGMVIPFSAAALAAFIPFTVLPVIFSMVVTTLLANVCSATRTREVLFALVVIGFLGGCLIYNTHVMTPKITHHSPDLAPLMAQVTRARMLWLPSSWVAICLGEVLAPSGMSTLPYGVALVCTMLASLLLGYIVLQALHGSGYSKTRSVDGGIRVQNGLSRSASCFFAPIIPAPYRALFGKEFKLFARDLTQALQLLLLLGICIVYLYNFRALEAVQDLPEGTRVWWQAFLVLSNLLMGSFVITAVSARFVFPTLSFEGRSFWILQSAPLNMQNLLSAKFWFWFTPISLISSVLFVSGGFAIQAEPHIIALSAVSSWVICYGIIGLGIGLGATFFTLDWEHPSQLTAGFGNFIYMMSGIILVLIDLIPTGLMMFLRTLRITGVEFTPVQWYTYITLCASLLVYINYAVTRWSLRIGAATLERKVA